jgi:hypothetical protein
VLTCQGLIFEMSDDLESSSLAFFTVTVFIIIFGTLVITVFKSVKRHISNDRSIFLTSTAADYLDNRITSELYMCNSSFQMDSNGILELPLDRLKKKLDDDQLQRVKEVHEMYCTLDPSGFAEEMKNLEFKEQEPGELPRPTLASEQGEIPRPTLASESIRVSSFALNDLPSPTIASQEIRVSSMAINKS